MSFISLNYGAPLQMFCRSHIVHRWDPSNQSGQLPLKSHHFPWSQIDLCLIYLKVCRSDFILTQQNLMWFKSFAFALTWKHKLTLEQFILFFEIISAGFMWLRGLRTFDLSQTLKADSWFQLPQSEPRLWRWPLACLHTLFVWCHMLLFRPSFCPWDYVGLSKDLVFRIQSHFWLLHPTSADD